MRWIFWLATLAQLYFVPLLLVQLYLNSTFAIRSSVVIYASMPEVYDSPLDVIEVYDKTSYLPLRNIVVLFVVIATSIMVLHMGRDAVDEALMEYQEQENPLMYKVTIRLLKELEVYHEVRILKEDEEGFAQIGMTGLVIGEEKGKYDILLPYQAVISLEKGDVEFVSRKINRNKT